MDQLDDFEIKPLSEGLGFHKKPVELKKAVQDVALAEKHVPQRPPSAPHQLEQQSTSSTDPRQTFSDLLKALDKPVGKSHVPMMDPLPQAPAPGAAARTRSALPPEMERPWGPRPSGPAPQPSSEVPSSSRDLRNPLQDAVQNMGVRRGAADSPMRMLERSSVSLPAGILDGVMTLALSLVFLVTLMTVTKVDLASLIMKTGLDIPTRLSFATLFMSVWLMYVVVSRSFFGRTLGEWTFDHQMGDDQQQKSATYPLRILWRAMLVLATGVVTIPLLSLAFNKDLLAPLTGVQLYRQR